MNASARGGLFDLSDRVVVITGGLGTLGAEFGSAILEHGGKVALLDVVDPSEAQLRKWGPLLESQRMMIVKGDVTDKDSVQEAFARVSERFGVPYGLVNNAAIDTPPDADVSMNGPFETYPESGWDAGVSVNLRGPFICSQVFGAAMARANRGSIVNIASIYGMVSPDQSIYAYRRQRGEAFFKPVTYSVTKAGLLNFSRYLATYWGRAGVRVNSLSFAGVENNQDEDFKKAYCGRIPVGRMATRSEYNGAIVFLMSDASKYMTGANMVMDGGWTAI